MIKKISLSLFFLLFINTPINAGNDFIGNGGGWPELKLIYFFKNSDTLIKPMIEKEIINTEYAKKLQKVLQQHDSIALTLIEFDKNLNSNFLFDGKTLKIKNSLLYINQNDPQPIQRILATVLSLQIETVLKDNNFKTSLSDLSQDLESIQFNEKKYPIHWKKNIDLFLNTLNIDIGNEKSQLVSLEDQNISYSLNGIISEQIPCNNLNDWRFSRWHSSFNKDRIQITFDGRTRCNGSIVKRDFLIEFNINGKDLIDETSIDLFIF